ncbi:hypothetical protein SCT_0257 [Sulfuricella sp. T08]|nr:hypothetical protein SCT_0257 [Sulfuricella sp. T08]
MSVPGLPWRVQQKLESLTEGQVRKTQPALYRWLHFGSTRERVRAVTFGPKHHFFGYYEKSPWNASQTMLLAHESGFNDRPPGSDDRVGVGVVHLSDNRFELLAESLSWNWQQGAMLAWHPAEPDHLLVHNDRRDGKLVGVVRDISGKEQRVYDRAIYAMSSDGKTAWSLNFARLATHRPGYGYAGVTDPWAEAPHPNDDGVYTLDLDSGKSHLIATLDELARRDPTPAMAGQFHWVNHIQASPHGKRIAFFHLWREGEKNWGVRLYVARSDGSELACALDTGRISHYDWLDEDRLLVWARRRDGSEHFLLVDVRDGSYQVYGEGILTEDGHDSFSPDRHWVLNDTYPDRYDMRTLMLVSWPEGKRLDIARLYSPKAKWWGEIRCDLHPRWRRDGRQVCIDSVHNGSRQIYVVDVEDLIA